MPSTFKFVNEGRTITRRRTYTTIREVYTATTDGPADADQVMQDLQAAYPVDTEHPVFGSTDGAIVAGYDLLRQLNPTALRVAVLYGPATSTGGVFINGYRSSVTVKRYEFPYTLPGSQLNGQPIPIEADKPLVVERTKKIEYRTVYVGANGDATRTAVEQAEADWVGRLIHFPIAGQGETVIPRLLEGATMSSDSGNRLYATYVFSLLMPMRPQTREFGDTVLLLPALGFMDEYSPSYPNDDGQYQVDVNDWVDVYGSSTPIAGTSLPGFS